MAGFFAAAGRGVMSEAVFLFNGAPDPSTAQQTADRNGMIRLYSADLAGHIGTTVGRA